MQYQKEEVRIRILEAAYAEFSNVGYARASVLNIATRAYVAIGNLYRYFGSKEALFDSLVGVASVALEDTVKEIVEKYTADGADFSSQEMATELASAINELGKKYHNGFALLMEKSRGSKYENFTDKLCEGVATICMGAMARYGKEDEFIAKIMASGIVNGSFMIIRNVSIDEREEKLKKLMVFYTHALDERI